MARTIKDIFCRFQTMQGRRVERKSGWDTHGLPVELQVEKKLGIRRDDIGNKISVEEYNRHCREDVMAYTALWEQLTEQMGYWVDLEHPYVTYTPEYIESVWWLLKQLYDKGLLYKGHSIQPYSPAAGTGLSSHELNQPGAYREVKDTSAVVQFKLNNAEACAPLQEILDHFYPNVPKGWAAEEPIDLSHPDPEWGPYLLAWTTTPWTLPSNTALAVGADIPYALIATHNPYTRRPALLLMAEARLGAYFSAEDELTPPNNQDSAVYWP